MERATELAFSVVSFAEIGVKAATGKLVIPGDLHRHILGSGLRVLGLALDHGLGVADLPMHHRDPFDRLLISQARSEDRDRDRRSTVRGLRRPRHRRGRLSHTAAPSAPRHSLRNPMPPEPFVHLHVHSEYSLLDGACAIDAPAARAAELGQPALALTDHGVMNGAVEFQKATRKHAIKPILGFEAYLCDDMRSEATRFERNHLTLLAARTRACATSSSSPRPATSTATGAASPMSTWRPRAPFRGVSC